MAMYNTKLNYNGEPCTWRHVSTVRGQALGNLPQKCGKAPSAEPTISLYPREASTHPGLKPAVFPATDWSWEKTAKSYGETPERTALRR